MAYPINFDRGSTQYVRLLSSLDPVWRWDHEVDPSAAGHYSSVDPQAEYPLLMGEFLRLKPDGKAMRHIDPSAAETANLDDCPEVPVYMMFAEKGRTDLQVARRVPLMFLGAYVAETKLIHSTCAFVLGEELYVGNVKPAGFTHCVQGLIGKSLAAGSCTFPIGRVLKLPADNGGWLRFVCNNPV